LPLNRDFIIVVGGRLVTALIGLLAIRASTTFLSPEQFGQLALLIVVQTFCGLFLINPIGQYINRHTHVWWENGTLLSRLSRYGYYLVLVSLLGAVAMFFVGINASIDFPLLASVILLLMILAGTWNATLVPMLNMLGFRAAAVWFAIITVLLGLVTSVALMQWFPVAMGWFSGQVIGMFMGALMAFRFLYVKCEKSFSSVVLIDKENILSYCVPLAIAAGLMWVQLSGYRLLVESYWGLAQLGFIVVGLMLAGQVWAIAESLAMQFLYPYFFKRISCEDLETGRQALSDLLNVLGPLYLLLAGVTVVLAPVLVFLLVDEKFSSAVAFVMMGSAIECCRALANVFGNAAQVTKRTRSLAFPYGVGAIVICLSLWFIGEREMEVFYVGVVLLLGAISMLFTMIVMMYREVKFILDVKRWCVSFVVMVSLAMGSYLVVDVKGWFEVSVLLGIVVVIAGGFSALLLWKSGALRNLLSVKLVEEKV